MSSSPSSELIREARRAGFRPDDGLRRRIDDALRLTSDPADVGRLLTAKAIALQGGGDATVCAQAAATAAVRLIEAGEFAEAAYASAMAAVFVDQTGDLTGAVDHAVAALVMLGDIETTPLEAVRAALAISGFFARLSAFDLAIQTGRRAFDGARLLEGTSVDAMAFSFGYIAAEGGHVAKDHAERERRLADAVEAAGWLAEHGQDRVSREMLGQGLFAEADLARKLAPPRGALEAASMHYPDAAPDLVAWHQLVRGSAALRVGDIDRALPLLDAAIPGLAASADLHCLVRAVRQRAKIYARLGDHESAYAEMNRLAEMTRSWQVDQVGQLADQVARRADLERSSLALRHAAQQLAEDIDNDPTTGVRSRRWLNHYLDDVATRDVELWALMFDLDHFKKVNDTHGHHVGDLVLARFGALLRDSTDDADAVARFGGEEFVIVIERDAFDPHVGPDTAARIRLETEAHDWDSIKRGLDVTVSCGVASGPSREIADLLRRADDALLDAKRRGRNRVSAAPDVDAVVG